MAANPDYIQPAGLPLAVPSDPIWRLSVDQYHRMIQMGILTADDPVQLLEGWLVVNSPKTPAHSVATQLTQKAISPLLPSGWYVDTHAPVTTEDSEPEPDVVVVRGHSRQYLDRHPGPKDVPLIIEVADSTLHRDHSLKKRLYARASVRRYWIINLEEKQIEVYTFPSGPCDQPDYQQRKDYLASDSIPMILDETQVGLIAVRDLLP